MRINGIAIEKRQIDGYPWLPPFDPNISYPEYPFSFLSARSNDVYDMVRQVLWDLDLDVQHRGTTAWNPLRFMIDEGATVVIKPNFVLDYNQAYRGRAAQEAVTTDGSVLRPIVDYAFKACGPSGKIIICDAPLLTSAAIFENVAEFTGTRDMVNELRGRGVPVSLLDLRSYVRHVRRFGRWQTYHLSGDPLGYAEFDLGAASAFADCADLDRLETDDWENVSAHHADGHHFYSIARTVLSTQAIINVPKLKTHKKTGLTVALKNFFGVSNKTHRLPHWRRGIDDRPLVQSPLREVLKSGYSKPLLRPFAHMLTTRIMHATLDGWGNWHGNDTLWRSVLDVDRIIFHGDANGVLHPDHQRQVLTIVDGIVAGEGLGPLAPKPRLFGTILAGTDPVEVDVAACHLMRLDPRKVRLIMQALALTQYPVTNCAFAILECAPQFETLSEPFQLPDDWEPLRQS